MNSTIQIHKAFKAGNFKCLKELVGNTPGFPNCHLSPAFGHCLEYAIYHSPVSFINELLIQGADPNYRDHDGFPSIIAALSSERTDRKHIINVLLEYDADINQHGLNDWTPLHWASAANDVDMLEFLLAKGSDPSIQTRVDDMVTPLDEAKILGCEKAATFLEKYGN